MSQKLYGNSNDFRVKKVLIASQYSGSKVELVETASLKQLPKSVPIQKLPTLELADGSFVFGSNAAAIQVANAQLKGANDKNRVEIEQWIDWSDNDLYQSVATWMYPTLGFIEASRPSVERAKSEVKSALTALNKYLSTRTYLVGERITLADVTVLSILLPLYENIVDAKFRDEYANVQRWFDTLVNQPQFKQVLGEIVLCESTPTFKEGAAPKKVEKKEEKKAEKKKEEKPKQEKKEKKKEAEPEDDGDDLGFPQEKTKDPWAELPKGNFDMDDFKRFYSNNPEDKSIPYFWEKFDKDNYSIWSCEYKYPEELTLVFMSCNLITGMFQRLDKMRKCAFGSMILFGEDNKSSISGVWVWRGQDLAFKLSPDWQIDYESYNWVKLDPNSDDTKKKVKEYFSWEGDFDGKKFNQGKIFK
ncbi:elongation factor 1-gamma [Tetranychus urticae]|uniref:eEF-1B gamma n=1 Tax=Tetranychus urticae TaxID=32264 RepID=T1KLH6_TETUR|nr:elongation factor 1-gamma [Tetranychus urticae]